MEPSNFAGLGNQGRASDLWVLSTIESHMRSGLPSCNFVAAFVLEAAGAKAAAPEAITATIAAVEALIVLQKSKVSNYFRLASQCLQSRGVLSFREYSTRYQVLM
mmetsp:Transcript_20359/g.30227  ORF Transcript_20359/g.30227 Transcript_20359/m.30227 type:complete len:105 (-) Transcript_20359:35-349(-)